MLIDTNILVDVALDRRPFSEPASDLLKLLQQNAVSAYISWHTVSNFYYVVAPAVGGIETREFIVDLLRFISVSQTGTEDILYAASLPMRDFEDAMQVAAARACGASHIVTRNSRDFERSPIPAVDVAEALRLLSCASIAAAAYPPRNGAMTSSPKRRMMVSGEGPMAVISSASTPESKTARALARHSSGVPATAKRSAK